MAAMAPSPDRPLPLRPPSIWPGRLGWLGALLALVNLSADSVADGSDASLSMESPSLYQALPLTSGNGATPIVMLGLGLDESLYRRAYDDHSDLDGDGLVDAGYRDALDYAGYFDPGLCYAHADGHYKASAAARGEHRHHCLGDWSGNFLNWLSMSRLDLVRWSLYGGRRSVDDGSRTVLERSQVPSDFHAWSKFHAGSDLALYTPFANDPARPGLSFCNVSYTAPGDGDSARSTAPPLLRVARGEFRLWAAADGGQCLWQEESASPDQPSRALDGLGERDYPVRVEVCDPAAATALQEGYCRRYPAGLKPAGVLQTHGEGGQLLFGLLTGSYSRPRSGGQLRRNVGRLAGNGSTDCSPGDEIDLRSGRFCTAVGDSGRLIDTLERLRMSGHRSGPLPGGYGGCRDGVVNRAGSPTPALLSPGPGSEPCSGWGNPLAEIQAEILRYLGGETTPTPAFAGDDSAHIAGLSSVAWHDAYAGTEHCADCSVLMLSTAPASFDSDELPAIAAFAGPVAAATTAIGSHEASGSQPLTGDRLIGRVGATPIDSPLPSSADHCSMKVTGDLAQARGLCPAAAAREGSYLIAGLAYRAWTGDLRPDQERDPASRGQQRARSQGIELAAVLPSLSIGTSTGRLQLTPACEANPLEPPAADSPQWRACSPGSAMLAGLSSRRPRDGGLPPYRYGRDFSADGRAGSLLLAWDGSSYGGDQDRDLLQLLSWCVGARCALDQNPPAGPDICWRADSGSPCDDQGQLTRSIGEDELLVRVELLAGEQVDSARLGYLVTGAEAGDGLQLPIQRQRGDDGSLIDGSAEPLNSDAAPGGAPGRWSRPSVRRYRPGSGSSPLLPSPLQLAAKYGGFDYPDGATSPMPDATFDSAPCRDSAWDQLDNASGVRRPDCLPDGHHVLADPGQLKARLGLSLDTILRRSGSRQGRAMLAGMASGPAVRYLAFHQASRRDGDGREVRWVGDLQALFVDRDGRLREDGNGNARLDADDYRSDGDPVVEFEVDAASRQAGFRRYAADPALQPEAYTRFDDPAALRPLWRAGAQLAAIADTDRQRDYAAPASNGRHLLTFLDFNLDGKAQAGEQQALLPASFGSGRQGLLNVAGSAAAEQLIRYLRGRDFETLRSRSLDDDGDGRPETMRLGDIVHSQPLLVGAPAESYDLLYGDRTYAEFFARYRSRRQVLYVGANDGLLHAFNAGFFEPATQRYRLAPDGSGISAHPLGSELWAWAPFNLLPVVGWLADPRYGHLWTMDGSPRAFDVRAFADDAVHPRGWGTLLVVGMRLGGGPVTLPEVGIGGANRDALGAFAAGLGSRDRLTTRSAYLILDITDPEQPPRLIAEFSDPSGRLGYTTSMPAVAAFIGRNATATSVRSDRWQLWFGNGPDQWPSATSSGSGRLFGLDLGQLLAAANLGQPALSALIGSAPLELGDDSSRGAPASFVGDPVSVDWDLDGQADALYAGSSGGTAGAPTGKLFKLDFRDSAQPGDWAAPAVLADPRRPVLTAPAATQDRSGRRWLLAGTGRLLADADRDSRAGQALFGIIDSLPDRAPAAYAGLIETTAAAVGRDGSVTGIAGVGSETRLVEVAAGSGGWRHALVYGVDQAAERSLSRSALVDGLLFASAYTPPASRCEGDGSSRLYGIDFRTGAARSRHPAFRLLPDAPADADLRLPAFLDLGGGYAGAASPQAGIDSRTGSALVLLTVPLGSGAMVRQVVAISSSSRSGEIDWRQTRGRR